MDSPTGAAASNLRQLTLHVAPQDDGTNASAGTPGASDVDDTTPLGLPRPSLQLRQRAPQSP
jgi:hypothetical protein